jgi:hypothetical protein
MTDELILNPNLREKLKGHKATIQKTASEILWKRGDIRGFLLDRTQREMLAEYERGKSLIHIMLCSRRLGKTYMLVTHAIETALKSPNMQLKYITDTQRNARDMALPIFREVLTSCPAEIKPDWSVHGNRWLFKNGSEIAMYGVDATGGDGLRGQACDGFWVDEAGFVDRLDVLVTEVLSPMIIQRGARGILSSTPPRNMDHPFISFVAQAEKNKALTKRTIYDCPRFTPKMIDLFIESAGGVDSEAFRREYLCEMVAVSDLQVVPEATETRLASMIYSTEPNLGYLPDCYVALDPGYADKAAILYGYYDFLNATIVIQREFVVPGQNTAQLANNIRKTEEELWSGRPPLKRVSDVDLRLIEDLRVLHGIRFQKTEKDDKEAQINLLRVLVEQGKIKIHESCVELLAQLKYAQWKVSASGRRDFKRTPELGHCDAIDALIYLIRNINRHRNPMPDIPVDPHSYSYDPRVKKLKTKNAKTLATIFRS